MCWSVDNALQGTCVAMCTCSPDNPICEAPVLERLGHLRPTAVAFRRAGGDDMEDSTKPFTLPGHEGEVYLWIEQAASIMLAAKTRTHHDPVELTSADARRLARALAEAADALDRLDDA